MSSPLAGWRRPTLGAWACLIVGLAVLLGLSAWQFERRIEKQDLMAKIRQQIGGPPLDVTLAIRDWTALDYRRVRVSGRFDHGKELFLYPRFHGGHPGLHVVTPLLRPGAPTVLVNRGWVPAAKKDRLSRPDGLAAGTVSLTGVARTQFAAGRFTPRNDPAKGFWTGYDPHAMGRAMGVGDVLPLIVEAERAADARVLPIGGVTRINFRDNHLQYALTWLALAAALVAVFLVFHRPRPKP